MNHQDHKLSEKWENLISETKQELDSILINLKFQKANIEIEYELLEKIIAHHTNTCQEASTALCKIINDYETGKLNDSSLISLSLWT